MTNGIERSVGVIAIQRKGDMFIFCLVQHADGHWGFPKGHPEKGESDEEAACRELAEETGIVDVALDTAHTFSERYSYERDGVQHEKEVKYFLGMVEEIEGETMDGFKQEITDVRWLSHDEARECITFEESRRVLEQAWEFLRQRLK